MNIDDFRSPTWSRFRASLEQRLGFLRQFNDSPNHDPIQTALIRGQIKEVKRILSLGISPSDGEADDPDE